MHACKDETVGHDVLLKRPSWYATMVQKLLCIDPADRMPVYEAVALLRTSGRGASDYPAGCDIGEYLPALVAGGESCGAAALEVQAKVDGMVASKDWDGIYCVLWQLQMESGITGEADWPPVVQQMIETICNAAHKHFLADAGEPERVANCLKPSEDSALRAEIAAHVIAQICLRQNASPGGFL